MFINYILKAKACLFAQHFGKVYSNISSAKDMLYNCYFDDEIDLRDYKWLRHLLDEAVDDYIVEDYETLSDSLKFIVHEFKKMMQRLDIKQDN